MLDLKSHFPFFTYNKGITYLDSAATAQVLDTVIEDQRLFDIHRRANAHRSGHKMGAWVDQKYHEAKSLIGEWLGVDDPEHSIVFNSGTTQALSDAVALIQKEYSGATIYVGADSHHSLYIPLRMLAFNSTAFKLKLIDIDAQGKLDLTKLEDDLKKNKDRKIIAFTAVSNVLGVVNDIEAVKNLAKTYGCTTILDASQIISKRKIDLVGFDFVAWSWHKLYGPTGLGCLYLGSRWRRQEPVRPGGGSVTQVEYDNIVWQTTAGRYESGTQHLNAICAIPNLVKWLRDNGQEIEQHDKQMAKLVNQHVPTTMFRPITESESGLLCLEPAAGAVEDYGLMLDAKNIMVRTGKLCAEPLVTSLTKNKSLIRLSWAAYTQSQDIEIAFDVLGQIHEKLRRTVR
jgi:cysteine desulfurase/selenocysteine lyase